MYRYLAATLTFLGLLAHFVSAAPVAAAQPYIGRHPDINGLALQAGRVAWAGGGSPYEIFLFDSGSGATTQLSHTPADSIRPSIDGDVVVWQDNGAEVWLYDIAKGTAKQLAQNPVSATARLAPLRVGGSRFAHLELWPDMHLAVHDGKVAWIGEDLKIYLHDISTGQTIPLGLVYAPTSLDFDSHHVVWTTSDADLLAWDVYLYDIGERQTSRIGTAGQQVFLYLRGDHVVWTDQQAGSTARMASVYHIDEGKTDTVSSGTPPSTVGSLWVDEGHVMWTQWQDGSPTWGLYAYDLGSGQTSRPTLGALPGHVGFTDGRMVWAEVKPGTAAPQVFLHDTAGGQTRPLTEGPGADQPSISGDWVVWRGWEPGLATWNMYLSNVATGQTAQVPGAPDLWPSPLVDAGRLAWVAGQDLDNDVFFYDYSSGATSMLTGLFDELASSPYKQAILGLLSDGIISGFADGTFRPTQPVARAQFAKMIDLSLGLAVSEGSAPLLFTDVERPLDDLYPDDYVATAAAAGIVKGFPGGLFLPYAQMTRAQLLTMVVRAAEQFKLDALDQPPLGWAGVLPATDPIHGANAARAEYSGLLAGIELATFDIWDQARRGEVAQVLWNLREK